MARIAVLLDIFGTRVQKDLEGVLDAAAEAGYEGVECRPMADVVSPRGLRLYLESRNLALAGMHIGLGEREKAPEVLDEMAEAGGRMLVVSGDHGQDDGEEAFRRTAQALNALGKTVAERGAMLCYRHRTAEFKKVSDKTGFQILCDETDPELVSMCVDTFWVAEAGKDPAVFIHKHRKRIALAHLTDGRPDNHPEEEEEPVLVELGIGALDFPSILKMLALVQPEWLTCAQDHTTLPPTESIRRSREYLSELGY